MCCADHDIKLDCLIEKGLTHISKRLWHSSRANNWRENFLYSSLIGDPTHLSLVRLVRFENSRGECSSSKLHPHPCLLRRALTAARSAMAQACHGSSRDERSDNCAACRQICTKCGKRGHVLPYADSSQRPSHFTGNGARACHRKGRTPQLSSIHRVAWQTHTLSTTTRSSATYFELGHTTLLTTRG